MPKKGLDYSKINVKKSSEPMQFVVENEQQTLAVRADQHLLRLREHQKAIDEMKTAADKINVVDDESQNKANEFILTIKALLKKLDAERKKILEPTKTFTGKINSGYKMYSTQLSAIVSELDAQNRKYIIEKRIREAEEHRKRQEEARKLQKEMEKKAAKVGVEVPTIQPAPIPEKRIVQTSMGTQTERKHWTFKVIDIKKVPAAYLQIDNRTVNAAIKEGVREIPGIEIYEEIIPVYRTN